MLGIIADRGNWCQDASSERVIDDVSSDRLIDDVRPRVHLFDFAEDDEDVGESSFKGVCQLLNRLERKQADQFRGIQDSIEKLALQVLSFTPSPNASANHSTAFAEAAFDVNSREFKGTGAAPSPHFSSTTPLAIPEKATRGSAISLMPQPGAVDATAASSNAPVVTISGGSLAAALPPPGACAARQNDTSQRKNRSEVVDVDSKPVSYSSKMSSSATKEDQIAAEMSSKKISALAIIRRQTVEISPAPHLKDHPGMKQWLSAFSRWCVRQKAFEIFISTVIVLNSVLVGIRVELNLRGRDIAWLHTMENYFLVIYMLELLLRFMGDGCRVIKNGWVIFDCVIVCAGILTLLLEDTSMTKWKPSFAEHVLIFRILRLLRLIRALRLIHFMKALGKLVNGLLQSMNAIFSTSFLVTLFLYIFAVVGVEVMRQDELLNRLEVVQTHFHSVPIAMLTLSQFVTLDSMASIYFPIISERPLLSLFFFPLVFLLSIALMGLVAAFLLEAALDRARTDKEMYHRQVRTKVKQLEPNMREAFRRIDANNNGVISREEVMAAYEFLPESLAEFVQAESLLELFEMLDEDDSGDVNEDEFVENLLAMAVSDVPLETMQMLKLLRIQRRRMADFADQLHILTEHMLPRDRKARQHRELERVDLKFDLESTRQMIL